MENNKFLHLPYNWCMLHAVGGQHGKTTKKPRRNGGAFILTVRGVISVYRNLFSPG
jgi:hypothetical protein